MRKLALFIGIAGGLAALIYPPYKVPVVNSRAWGFIWADVDNSLGALKVSDHIDWLVLGLELGVIAAIAIGLTVLAARR